MANHDIPRRCRLDLMMPSELAIRKAILEVETVGAHPLLTDAVILLQQAQRKVADFVDLPHPYDPDPASMGKHKPECGCTYCT